MRGSSCESWLEWWEVEERREAPLLAGLAGSGCGTVLVPGRGPNTTYTGLGGGAGCDNKITPSSQLDLGPNIPWHHLYSWVLRNFSVEQGLQ